MTELGEVAFSIEVTWRPRAGIWVATLLDPRASRVAGRKATHPVTAINDLVISNLGHIYHLGDVWERSPEPVEVPGMVIT